MLQDRWEHTNEARQQAYTTFDCCLDVVCGCYKNRRESGIDKTRRWLHSEEGSPGQRIGFPPQHTSGPGGVLKIMQGSSTLRTCNPKSRAPYSASSSVRSSSQYNCTKHNRGFQVPGDLRHVLAWARDYNPRTKRKATLEKQYGCLPESPSSPDPLPLQDIT